MLKDRSFETELSPYDHGLADGSSSGFARAVQALEELAPSIAWAARAAEHLRGVASLGHQPPVSTKPSRQTPATPWRDEFGSIAERAPVSDPEEAARERLGKWLAADSQRTWQLLTHRGIPAVKLYRDAWDDDEVAIRGEGPAEAAAITAALDAAEAREGKS